MHPFASPSDASELGEATSTRRPVHASEQEAGAGRPGPARRGDHARHWRRRRPAALPPAVLPDSSESLCSKVRSTFARKKTAEAVRTVRDRVRIARLSRHAWQPDGRAVFLLISHSCGGGTHRHVMDMTAAAAEGRHPTLARSSRPSGPACSGKNTTIGGSRSGAGNRRTRAIRSSAMLALVRPAHAHVHHLMGVPDLLFDLAGRARHHPTTGRFTTTSRSVLASI